MTWDDARAAILLVVIGVHGFAAAPLAHHARSRDLRQPLVRDEFSRLQAALATVGVHVEVEDLAEGAYALSVFESDLRRAGLAPFRSVLRLTGTGQAWGLFTYPDRFPHRLWVRGRAEGGAWTPLYVSLDPDADFNEEKFVYRRIRGIYDNNSDRQGPTWDAFCTWAAREVFAAYPEIDEVEVSFQRIYTHEPGEAATVVEEGKRHGLRVRRRP